MAKLMSSNGSVISEIISSIKTLIHFLEKESSEHFGCGAKKTTLKKLEKKFTFIKNINNENKQVTIEKEIQDSSDYFLATSIDLHFKLSFFFHRKT